MLLHSTQGVGRIRVDGLAKPGLLATLDLCGPGLVAADDPPAPAARGDQVVRRPGTPRPHGVDLRVAFGLPGLDERVDDLPLQLDLLGAWKRRVSAGQHL